MSSINDWFVCFPVIESIQRLHSRCILHCWSNWVCIQRRKWLRRINGAVHRLFPWHCCPLPLVALWREGNKVAPAYVERTKITAPLTEMRLLTPQCRTFSQGQLRRRQIGWGEMGGGCRFPLPWQHCTVVTYSNLIPLILLKLLYFHWDHLGLGSFSASVRMHLGRSDSKWN